MISVSISTSISIAATFQIQHQFQSQYHQNRNFSFSFNLSERPIKVQSQYQSWFLYTMLISKSFCSIEKILRKIQYFCYIRATDTEIRIEKIEYFHNIQYNHCHFFRFSINANFSSYISRVDHHSNINSSRITLQSQCQSQWSCNCHFNIKFNTNHTDSCLSIPISILFRYY